MASGKEVRIIDILTIIINFPYSTCINSFLAAVRIRMKSTKVQILGGNIGTFGLETPICMHMY